MHKWLAVILKALGISSPRLTPPLAPPPRPVVIPFPAPPPPAPVTPPVGPANPPDASRAALIAATTARFIEAHNRARAVKGLPPYQPSGALAWSAEDIVQFCAPRGTLDHFAGGSSTPWSRMAARGVVNVPASENLALGYDDEAGAVAGWLDEPDLPDTHRANVLSPIYSHLGGSVAVTADGRKIFACDYARLG